MRFPIQHAALSLRGKPPEELPHGLLPVPPEVRELIEEKRTQWPPEVFAREELGMLNLETVGWYFDGLNMQVMYRETPQGPEVLAVGRDEVLALKQSVPYEGRKGFKTFLGYLST
jgi:hypothetical protein